MADRIDLDSIETRREFSRSFMWPFVYWPTPWVGIIHAGTRLLWYLGIK